MGIANIIVKIAWISAKYVLRISVTPEKWRAPETDLVSHERGPNFSLFIAVHSKKNALK